MTKNKWINYFKDPLNFTASFGLIKPEEVITAWERDMEKQLYKGVSELVKKPYLYLSTSTHGWFSVDDFVVVGSTMEEGGSFWYCVIPIHIKVAFRFEAGSVTERHTLESPEAEDKVPVKITLDTSTAFQALFKATKLKHFSDDHKDITSLFKHPNTSYEQAIPETLYLPAFDKVGQNQILIEELQKYFLERRRTILKRFLYMTELDEEFRSWLKTKYH